MTHPLSVCVFCGARPGAHPAYMKAAQDLGDAIGSAGWRLVFGAGDAGIMGAVAAATRSKDGATLGVIPEHLVGWEAKNESVSNANAIITDDMHSRKKLMFTNSDAVVVLPGGAGSLDEFFEVLTWAQLGLHKRPIIIANIEGYWDPLITLLDHVISQGFASETLHSHYRLCDTVDDVLTALRSSENAAKEKIASASQIRAIEAKCQTLVPSPSNTTAVKYCKIGFRY